MPSRSTDALFHLIKSLTKSEKRNFKLYAKRNTASVDLKVIQVFDAIDKMKEYDERSLFKKYSSVKKEQLSNIKAHLYKQILSSLRLIREEDNIDIFLHEQLDHARILYNKGLYLQSLRVLDRLKETARNYQQLTYLQQALFFEKKIETLFITRSMHDRAEQLSLESEEINKRLEQVSRLSNLSLQLYSWYIKNGMARNKRDLSDLEVFFKRNLPVEEPGTEGFYEKLYRNQCQVWYAFIRQDFLHYYRYSQKWVDLFSEYPGLLKVETASYIKGMHNLMNAHFYLLDSERLNKSIKLFEQFLKQVGSEGNENNRIQSYQYLYAARINLCFLQGRFTKGLQMVPFLEDMLKTYSRYLDRHRVTVFYYKIACLYFGSGDNEKAIDYLNRIINQGGELRTDLQCYARLLHLIAHYELGNYELLEYLVKSVYRYMAKMENLSKVEEEIFAFLRRSFRIREQALKPEFEKLHDSLQQYEKQTLESRAFVYLDLISWLESKIRSINVETIIREKYLLRNNK